MLSAVNVYKTFVTKNKLSQIVLNNVSFTLPQKGMVFILGKSGSGKSTMLNLLSGIDSCEQGEILVKGKSTKNFKQKDFDNFRNVMLGFVFQEFHLFEDMTVEQNIAISFQLQGKKPDFILINQLLKQSGLEGLSHRFINELSGGQKQRVAILRALAKNSEIILCDEPTGNLDSETSQEIFEILKKISLEKLVVVVTHDVENAFKFGDRVIEFKDGQIISDLEKSNVKVKNVKNNKQILKEGQVLTAELLAQIQKEKVQNADLKKNFITTKTQSVIDYSSEKNIQEQKCGTLPISIAAKIGFSALKKKKVFLFISSLLGVFSLWLLYYSTFIITVFSSFINELKNLKTSNILEYGIKIEKLKNVQKIFYFVIIIILLINFFIIGNFMKNSIKFKKKEIGILRALGASGTTVSKIFFSEGFIFSSLITIFFIILDLLWFHITDKISYIINNYKEVDEIAKKLYENNKNMFLGEIFTSQLFILGFIFLLANFVVLISVFLPIFRLARKKPIEVILNK